MERGSTLWFFVAFCEHKVGSTERLLLRPCLCFLAWVWRTHLLGEKIGERKLPELFELPWKSVLNFALDFHWIFRGLFCALFPGNGDDRKFSTSSQGPTQWGPTRKRNQGECLQLRPWSSCLAVILLEKHVFSMWMSSSPLSAWSWWCFSREKP